MHQIVLNFSWVYIITRMLVWITCLLLSSALDENIALDFRYVQGSDLREVYSSTSA